MNPMLSVPKVMPTPKFGNHSVEQNFSNALTRAYDWSQGRYGQLSDIGDQIGFYQTGYKNPQYHVVSGPDLAQAIQDKVPHLTILQRFNQLGKTMNELYPF